MFEDITVFRLVTSIISFCSVIYLFWSLKKIKLSVGEFIFWFTISLIILLLSLKPSVLEIFYSVIQLSTNERYDRLILISYTSFFLIIAIVYYYRGKLKIISERQTRSIQYEAVNTFMENIREVPNNDLIIVIPAYNEEENIFEIIENIPKKICGFTPFVLTVSDGSEDSTNKILKEKKVFTAIHSINLGQCAAYRTGYKIAKNLKFRYLVHLDADGQYDPNEIEKLVKPLIDDSFDFISGSRTLGYYENKYARSQIIRTLGIFIFNLLLTILLRKKITDSASGFRSINVTLLNKLNFKQNQFHSTELLIEAISKNAKFKEVPVSFLKRGAGISKKPNAIKYGIGFLRTIIKTWLRN